MLRLPVFAGSFYPDDPAVLREHVRQYLAAVPPKSLPGRLRGVLVPHAGYEYSGAVAGVAYAHLQKHAKSINRVVLLGPSHRVGFSGIALPVEDAFSTPLGELPIDASLRALLTDFPQAGEQAAAHQFEHSLEVQFPFLQIALPGRPILPLVVGFCDVSVVVQALELLMTDPTTVIVVSSDFSHYHPYEDAHRIDGATAQKLISLEADISPEQACGAYPLNGLVGYAKKHHWEAVELSRRNSGDSCGDKDRVVGYGAFAFTDKEGF